VIRTIVTTDCTLHWFNVAKPFWRNVVLIALAHVALIAGLIHWSVAARASSNAESIVWLGSAEVLSPRGESEQQETLPPKRPIEIESSRSEQDEAAEEKAVVSAPKSEIELPAVTPKPTATATAVKASATPVARHKPTPKPTPKPTARKTLSAKVSPKPAIKPKPTPAKANAKSEKKDKVTLAKKDSAAQSVSGPSGLTGKAGGGSSASEFGWYGDMLHDRFYSAWIQPTANVPSGEKISTLVKVQIEKDGRISKFEIARPSGNAMVNESVAAVAKQVSQVDPPPASLIKGDHYDVKINFELNTEEKRGN
jgi:TonB family protein